FSINRKAHTLTLDMTLPALLRPNTALRVPIKVGGLNAAVDVGILNLTGYKPPAPDDYYLGQRRSPPTSATSTVSSSTACRVHAGRSRPAVMQARWSCRLRPPRKNPWRSIPASSPSSPTARPRSCSTFRILPEPPA